MGNKEQKSYALVEEITEELDPTHVQFMCKEIVGYKVENRYRVVIEWSDGDHTAYDIEVLNSIFDQLSKKTREGFMAWNLLQLSILFTMAYI
jgi:hypothetical protein